jgi:hypothetical protein
VYYRTQAHPIAPEDPLGYPASMVFLPLLLSLGLGVASEVARSRTDEQLDAAVKPYGFTSWEEAALVLELRNMDTAWLARRLRAGRQALPQAQLELSSMGLPRPLGQRLQGLQRELEALGPAIEAALEDDDIETASELEATYDTINRELISASSELGIGDPKVENSDGFQPGQVVDMLVRWILAYRANPQDYIFTHEHPRHRSHPGALYREHLRALIAKLAIELEDPSIPLVPVKLGAWTEHSRQDPSKAYHILYIPRSIWPATGVLHARGSFQESQWPTWQQDLEKLRTADLSDEEVDAWVEDNFGRSLRLREQLREQHAQATASGLQELPLAQTWIDLACVAGRKIPLELGWRLRREGLDRGIYPD